jgi:hypothetical protein
MRDWTGRHRDGTGTAEPKPFYTNDFYNLGREMSERERSGLRTSYRGTILYKHAWSLRHPPKLASLGTAQG